MRFSFAAIAFVLMFGALFASTTYQMSTDAQGVEITKTLVAGGSDRTLYMTDPSAGVVNNEVGAKVSISVKNTNSRTVRNLAITEDITWITSTKNIKFSSAPNENDGRKVAWNIDSLAPSEKVEFSYITDAPINPKVVSAMEMPAVAYSNPSAVLNAPRNAKQGEQIAIYLTGTDRKAAGNALITVTSPLGDEFELRTNPSGMAFFKPADAGYYTYSVEGYDVAFLPTTEVSQIDFGAATAAATVPEKPKDKEMPFFGALAGAWPLIAGIMLVALVAFALYAYLNTSAPAEQSYEPMPPAPATRPSISDEPEQNGMSYKISYGTSGEDVKEQTRSLVERRMAGAKAADEAQPQEGTTEFGQGSLVEEKIAPKEDGYSEEEQKSQKRIDALPDADSKDHLPPWMKEGYEGESTVDDETIRKTIEELEQLRAELQAKQEGREMPPESEETEVSEPEEGEVEEEVEQEAAPIERARKPRIFPRKSVAKKTAKRAVRKGRR